MWKSALKIAFFAGCLFDYSVSFAEAEELHPQLRFRSNVDVPVIAGSAIAVGAFSLFEDKLAANHCRWCDDNGFDRSFRNQLRWSDTGMANNLSHGAGFLLTPIFSIGAHAWLNWRDGDFGEFYKDAAIISEATLLAAFVGKVVQFSFGRERPDAHFSGGVHKAGVNTSFYSGHSTIAFALATSSGTVASLRERSEAPWIWAGGLGLAGLTAYLRVAADRHYMSDVLVGAAAGSAIGFAVPYFFHAPDKATKTTSSSFEWMALPSREGLLASFRCTW